MDVLTPPERLSPGEAQLIENLLISPRGELQLRPGFQGQLTTPLGGPIYLARGHYVMPDASRRLVFASGATTAKLYRYTPGATSATEIVKSGGASFAFTSQGKDVRFAFWGRYVYLLDGGDTSGSIWRVDLSTGGQAVSLSALTAPTAAPTATLLGGSALVSGIGALTWGNSPGTDTEIIAVGETNFANAAAFWTFREGASNANTLDANGLQCIELDADGGSRDYVQFTDAQALPAFGSTVPGLESLKRRLARLEFTFAATENTGSTDPEQSVRAVLSPTDTNGYMFEDSQVDSITPTVRVYPASRFRTIADWRGVTGATHVQLRLESSTADGTKGNDVNQIKLTVPDSTLAVSNASGVASVKQGSAMVFNDTLYAGGLSAWATLAASQDWSAISSVTADIRKDAAVESLAIELGAKTSAGWFWSAPVSITDQVEVAFDIASIRGSLGTVTQVAFRVESDLTVANLAVSGTQTLFTVTNLRTPGSLTVGASYTYLYSDFDADGATYEAGGIESSGSPDSTITTPTSTQRRISVTIPGAFSPAGDKFLIWRRGGERPDSDTRPALAAMVSTTANGSGTGWSWDYTTRVFTDNIPDTDLWFADTYQVGRDAPPTGGRCLTVHAQRLFVGVYDATRQVNDVHVSWLLDGGTDAGYYFTRAQDPADPEGEIKGALLHEAGGAGDRIQAFASMIPPAQTGQDMLSAHLLVLREGGPPSTLTGWRGGIGVSGAFQLLGATQEGGGGCIASQSAEFIHGVWWAAAVGLVAVSGGRIIPVADAISPLLSLKDIGQARYPQVFTLWHDRQAWVLVPGSGSTDGAIYLWDEQAPQGPRWVKLSSASGFVSACSLSGGQDVGELYLGGRNGQLFLYAGTADKATPAGGNVAISFALTSRRYGQGESGGVSFFSDQRAQQIQIEAEAGAALSVTGSVTGDGGATRAFAWAFATGASRALVRGLGNVQGTTHQVALTGSATTATSLRGLGLTVTETSNRR
jgi:hypothetical protein